MIDPHAHYQELEVTFSPPLSSSLSPSFSFSLLLSLSPSPSPSPSHPHSLFIFCAFQRHRYVIVFDLLVCSICHTSCQIVRVRFESYRGNSWLRTALLKAFETIVFLEWCNRWQILRVPVARRVQSLNVALTMNLFSNLFFSRPRW